MVQLRRHYKMSTSENLDPLKVELQISGSLYAQ